MINRDSKGHSYSNYRGVTIGQFEDKENQFFFWIYLTEHIQDFHWCRPIPPTSCMELQWQLQLLGQLHKNLQLSSLISDGPPGHFKVHANLPNAEDVLSRQFLDLLQKLS